MITSAKNYTKKKKQMDRQNPRTNRKSKSKAIQTKSHTEAHTYTLTKEKKIYIYCCSQSPPPQFGMIPCLFKYSRDAGYIKLMVEI